MQGLLKGFPLSLFFAFLAITLVPDGGAAQDMPPILAPPDLPAIPATPAPIAAAPARPPADASPSAQAAIPPAVPPLPASSVAKLQTAAKHAAPAHHRAASAAEKHRFAALMRRLAARHRSAVHRVAVREANLPPLPGAVVPPPGYYPPGPYRRLVFGGPPPGPYGWGYRPFPYDGYP